MDWFKRKKETLQAVDRKEMPDGLWVKCAECGEIIYKKELDKKLSVCPKCDHHFRIGSNDYQKILIDKSRYVLHLEVILINWIMTTLKTIDLFLVKIGATFI